MHRVFCPISILAGCVIILVVTTCNGIFKDIYDEAPATASVTTEDQPLVSAASWKNWHYVDFDSLQMYIERKDTAGLLKAQTNFTCYAIPTNLTLGSGDGKTGMYAYWFDAFRKGVSVNEKRGFTATDAQPEPQLWSTAFHRNNVRTNGGAVLETKYTSLNELPKNSSYFLRATFQEDEWTESEVWGDQLQVLISLISCQGIRINKVLSSWLKIEIPPMPPLFVMNSHVFIVRLKNSKYVALQLENYIGADGTKCWLRINYKYPY